jgi:hypothetical protein
MKYLYENGFTVLTMRDLAFDVKTNHVFIKQFHEPETSGKIAGVISNGTALIQKPLG